MRSRRRRRRRRGDGHRLGRGRCRGGRRGGRGRSWCRRRGRGRWRSVGQGVSGGEMERRGGYALRAWRPQWSLWRCGRERGQRYRCHHPSASRYRVRPEAKESGAGGLTVLPCMMDTTGFFIFAMNASMVYSCWKNSLALPQVALSSRNSTRAALPSESISSCTARSLLHGWAHP